MVLFAIDEQIPIKVERQTCPSNLVERRHCKLIDLLPHIITAGDQEVQQNVSWVHHKGRTKHQKATMINIELTSFSATDSMNSQYNNSYFPEHAHHLHTYTSSTKTTQLSAHHFPQTPHVYWAIEDHNK